MCFKTEAVSTETYLDLTIEIWPDQDCPSPRENCNLGTIVGWHRDYTLTDEPHGDTCVERTDFDAMPDLARFLTRQTKGAYRAIYLHGGGSSGVYLTSSSMSDLGYGWHVGYIYVTATKLRREYGKEYDTIANRLLVQKVLAAEVKEFGEWMNGDTYGYIVKDKDGKEIDSCWGYIGYDDVLSEAKASVDHHYDTIEHQLPLLAV